MLQSLPKYEKKDLSKVIAAPPDAIDIIEKLLAFNPAKRLTVEQALDHPYMKAFRTGAEVKCPGIMTIPIDDDHKFTVTDYREKLYNQVVVNRKDRAARMASYFNFSARKDAS